MAWNDGLDAESAAFRIASSVNEHIRVVAGPGAGKSFAMKRRVARLLEEGIEAGLRICRDGNCVDGTLQALLADRRVIEARLLARLDEHAL